MNRLDSTNTMAMQGSGSKQAMQSLIYTEDPFLPVRLFTVIVTTILKVNQGSPAGTQLRKTIACTALIQPG